MANRMIKFDVGLETIKRGMDKLISFVDANGVNRGETISLFSPAEKMSMYEAVYFLCTQKQVTYEKELYSLYEAFFQQYINSKVLPAMREKHGEPLLREAVKRWRDYKFIVQWMKFFFLYLDQFFIKRYNHPTMRNTALLIFHNLVYEEMKGQIISTVLLLINEDRDGKRVDRALVKEVLELFFDLRSEALDVYRTDFEPALLDSSVAYYTRKMANWVHDLSYSEYMLQILECLNVENSRAAQYLHPNTVPKLLERLELELGNPDRSDVSSLAGKVQQLELGSNRYC